jgi:hypothetical protein
MQGVTLFGQESKGESYTLFLPPRSEVCTHTQRERAYMHGLGVAAVPVGGVHINLSLSQERKTDQSHAPCVCVSLWVDGGWWA